MSVDYGRKQLTNTGRAIAVAAQLAGINWKTGGITIDWSTVTAVGADTTLPDDLVILNGTKGLRFGQIMTRIGAAQIETVTLTGGPTAGSAVISLPASGNDPAATFSIGFADTAAVVQAAALALSRFSRYGANALVVARTGAGSAGSPYVYTFTFNRTLGLVPTFTSPSNTFTGGTSPSVTIAISTAGLSNNGQFGPYDPAASDGRQTLARGDCFILNESVLENGVIAGLQTQATTHPVVFDGGNVWKDRVLMTTGTHSLAAGPTVTELEAAFPAITYVQS